MVTVIALACEAVFQLLSVVVFIHLRGHIPCPLHPQNTTLAGESTLQQKRDE